MVQKVEKIFRELSKQITNEKENQIKYAIEPKSFTRVRKLPISTLVLFNLNMSKRTLSVELEQFFKLIGKESCTVGALTQRKKQLSHRIFIDLNQDFIDNVYKKIEIKRWQGKRIIAVDGTKIYLFNKEEVKKEFGVQRTNSRDVPMGHVISSYDVLNNLCINSKITALNRGEGTEAIERVKSYDQDMIVIYDRGFASYALMSHHMENKIPFVIRVKKDFNKETKKFAESKAKEAIVELRISHRGKRVLRDMGYNVDRDTKIKVRLVRIELENDFTIIATSLKNRKNYNRKKFKELYNLRWGIETYYDKLKNKMKLETFSGRTVESIKQEFYSTILVSNIHSLIVKTAKEMIPKIEKVKKNKYEYKINQNVSIGLLKDKIVELLISNSIRGLLLLMIGLFIKYKIPIRPNRKNARSKKKYLIRGRNRTLLNYNTAL